MVNVKSLFLSTWSLFSVNLVPFWSLFCEKSGPFMVPIRDFFLQGPDLSSLCHIEKSQRQATEVENFQLLLLSPATRESPIFKKITKEKLNERMRKLEFC